MKKSNLDKAATYAYRLLSIRPRSERELKERLFQKRYKKDITNKVIESLKEKEVVNDLKFAKSWIDSRTRRNPKGKALLKLELRAKGVKASVIEEVLKEKKDDISTVRELANKKMNTLKKEPKEKAKRKLFSYLARRGFDFDIINDVLREFFG